MGKMEKMGMGRDEIIEKLGEKAILIRESAYRNRYKDFYRRRYQEERDSFKKYKNLIKSWNPYATSD
jgi:hypothetical protein